MAVIDESDVRDGRLRGTDDADVITISQDVSATLLLSGGPVHGGLGDDVYNLHFNAGTVQFHTFERGDGDDRFNLFFAPGAPGVIAHGAHVRTGVGRDVAAFANLAAVTGVAVGRLEDFSYRDDRLVLEGAALDLMDLAAFNAAPPAGVARARVVHFNGAHNDPGAAPQQWLLIETTGGGAVLYALEGARIDLTGDGGSNLGAQERHFIKTAPDFAALPDAPYVDPVNSVPIDLAPLGGLVINDVDRTLTDLAEVVEGGAEGDLIAGGLNGDVILGHGGADHIWGGSGADTVDGGAGDDTVEGGPGADALAGGAGDDMLAGGAGPDALEGGAGFDLASYADAAGAVRADLANAVTGAGEAEGDVFSSIEGVIGGRYGDRLWGDAGADVIDGGASADRLYGRGGDDSLSGGFGVDVLYGNGGADMMSGGAGRDRFVYFTADDSGVGPGARDVIADFDAAAGERLEIGRIDADLSEAGGQVFAFIGAAAFTGAAGELRFEHKDAATLVQADRDGDGAADFEIELMGLIDLTEANFLL